MKLPAALVLFSSAAFAAAPAIGIVSASGQFQLEGSRIWGNSTLFDGAKVETTDASSEVALNNGIKVQLAAGSSARVWKNHIDLERGTGQVTAASPFFVNAAGYTIDGARYRVGLQSARLEVASLTDGTRVLGSRGALLSAVPAGRSLSFAMLQTVTRTGCLVFKTPGFLLQVDDSPDVLQLTGSQLAQSVGNRVEITGTPAGTAATISPATSILLVTSIAVRAAGGCLTTAAALNAQTSVSGPVPATPTATTPSTAPVPGTPATEATIARAGMSTGAKIGIIGAVAGGGAVAGLALGGKKKSTSP